MGADVYLQTNLPCAPSSLSRERFLLRAGPKKYEGTNSSNQIPGRNRDDFVFRSVGPNSGLLASRESRDCSVFGTTFRDYFSGLLFHENQELHGQIRADKKVDPIPARIFTNGV